MTGGLGGPHHRARLVKAPRVLPRGLCPFAARLLKKGPGARGQGQGDCMGENLHLPDSCSERVGPRLGRGLPGHRRPCPSVPGSHSRAFSPPFIVLNARMWARDPGSDLQGGNDAELLSHVALAAQLCAYVSFNQCNFFFLFAVIKTPLWINLCSSVH